LHGKDLLLLLHGSPFRKSERISVRISQCQVQHRGLRESAPGDIEACALAVRAVSLLFPAFRLSWLVDEIAPALPRELDFCLERANCVRCATHFKGWADVVVPEVFPAQSSSRVLTMSFEEGFSAADAQSIEAAGIDTAAAAKLIGAAWLEQTYRHGFVHCDPHAGNVLVRRFNNSNGRPQIVLLDHGLYRELNPDFRVAFAAIWRAIILADLPGIELAAKRLGVGDSYPLFAAILTQRPWDDIAKKNDLGRLSTAGRGAADEVMIRAHAQRCAHTRYFYHLSDV